MGKPVNKTKSGRKIMKPVEIYHQDCVLKATVMQNRRDRVNGPQRSQPVSERKKKSREVKKRELEEKAKEEKRKELEKKKRLEMRKTIEVKKRKDKIAVEWRSEWRRQWKRRNS